MSTPKSSAEMNHLQLRERNEALAKENAMLTKTLQAYKEKTVNISRLVDKYKKLEALYKGLQAEKEQSCARVDQARDALSTAKESSYPKNLKHFEANVLRLTSERDAVLNDLSTCRAQHDGMKAKLEEETARSTLLAKERDELAAVATDTSILIKDCVSQISELRNEVHALKRQTVKRICTESLASEMSSIRSYIANVDQRASDCSSAQAASAAELASLRAQQQETAAELTRIRAVFSAIAAPAELAQRPAPCSSRPPAPVIDLAPVQPVVPNMCNPPSPPATNMPSSASGRTALQLVRSMSPDVRLASASGHSIPLPATPSRPIATPDHHEAQLDNNTATGRGVLNDGSIQQRGSVSPRWEGSRPLLIRSPTRSSAVGDTPAEIECVPGPTAPSSALTGPAASCQDRAVSPGTTAGSQMLPQKRFRAATAGNAAKESRRANSAVGAVESRAAEAVQRDHGTRSAVAPSPMKRPPPRAKSASRAAGMATAAKERPVLPVRRVDCPMPRGMFQSSAPQSKAPSRAAMQLGSGKVKSTFISGSGFLMATRTQPEPTGAPMAAAAAAETLPAGAPSCKNSLPPNVGDHLGGRPGDLQAQVSAAPAARMPAAPVDRQQRQLPQADKPCVQSSHALPPAVPAVRPQVACASAHPGADVATGGSSAGCQSLDNRSCTGTVPVGAPDDGCKAVGDDATPSCDQATAEAQLGGGSVTAVEAGNQPYRSEAEAAVPMQVGAPEHNPAVPAPQPEAPKQRASTLLGGQTGHEMEVECKPPLSAADLSRHAPCITAAIRCDHGARLVGKLLCASAVCVHDAVGVALAVMLCEPLGALGRHMGAQRQFWRGAREEPRGVALRPMAGTVAVAMSVIVDAAYQHGRGELTRAAGAVARVRGVRVWGWCPVGTAGVTRFCAATVQMLVAAAAEGGDAGRVCWGMCEEFESLQKRVGRDGGGCGNKAGSGREAGGSASLSSSSSGISSGGDSSESSQCQTGDSGESGHVSEGGFRAAALSAGVQEAMDALEVAAECCGWRWTIEKLVDGTVWPAVQRLRDMRSKNAELVHSSLMQLMERLLDKVVTISKNDEIACEWAASTREALQFVG
eukprot:jgi/Ulvmu1/7925/UM004_0157.1